MATLTFTTIEKILELKENKVPHKLVDVLSEDSFNNGHIPGAINIPMLELEGKIESMFPDKDELIIFYCSGYLCQSSSGAAEMLVDLGYTNILDFKGGLQLWKTFNLPLQK